MKVTARPQQVCGTCRPCKKGQYNACQNLKVEGFQAPGVAQDLFVVPENRIVSFPEEMSFEQGALIEPAAVGAHATDRATEIRDKNVVVSGAGTIGNLVAQYARIRGANRVLITDISNYRLNIARTCNIDAVLNVNETSFEEGILDYFGEEGFQVAFEAAGVQASLDGLLRCVDKGGEVVILGVYSRNPVVNMYYLGEHELNVYGSMMYRHEDYESAVKMISSGRIITMPLITRSFPFEKFHIAYEFISRQGDEYMKVMIDM